MKTIKTLLNEIYGNNLPISFHRRFEQLIAHYKNIIKCGKPFSPSQQDILLITYADIVHCEELSPLQSLKTFLLDNVGDSISIIHLLPFFPYSSDDGFSVIDYYKVDQANGDWQDIAQLSEHYQLCFDAVFNHNSAQSEWFKQFLQGAGKYADYYIEIPENAKLDQVVRPRTSPLVSEYHSATGLKRVWTTFSRDQVDLNFASPELLLDIVEIMLFYIEHGANILRMDAVAFLWKEIGTSSLHLPQTHLLVKLFRAIADEVAPQTAILTETNVPHLDNISYFGNGDEAHLVYQFPLAPLVAHALLKHDTTALTAWADGLAINTVSGTFLNFLASHDGIGVNPARGLISESAIGFLADMTVSHGGQVSYKTLADGSEVPYELNINYYSLLNDGDETMAIKRFLVAHAVMLTMPGIPAIYFHSLFGSENYYLPNAEPQAPRTINREKIDCKLLCLELAYPNHRRSKIFSALKKLIDIRRQHQVFHPDKKFKMIKLHPQVFVAIRGNNELLCICNCSAKDLPLNLTELKFGTTGKDLLTGVDYDLHHLYLKPYQILWLVTLPY